MFLFTSASGTVLHTGDFRWEQHMQAVLLAHPALTGMRVDELYLDNTYCHPQCTFPPRSAVCQELIRIIRQKLPTHAVLIGMDLLGKEELLAALAHSLGVQIAVSAERLATCQLMRLPRHLFTLDGGATRVRTIPRWQASVRMLAHLNRSQPTFCVVPTGWQPAVTQPAGPAKRQQLAPKPAAAMLPPLQHVTQASNFQTASAQERPAVPESASVAAAPPHHQGRLRERAAPSGLDVIPLESRANVTPPGGSPPQHESRTAARSLRDEWFLDEEMRQAAELLVYAPYSLHCSHDELRSFVAAVRPAAVHGIVACKKGDWDVDAGRDPAWHFRELLQLHK